jgi:hypothetical protein
VTSAIAAAAGNVSHSASRSASRAKAAVSGAEPLGCERVEPEREAEAEEDHDGGQARAEPDRGEGRLAGAAHDRRVHPTHADHPDVGGRDREGERE